MRRFNRLLAWSAAAIVLMAVAAPAWAALPPGGSFIDDDGNVHEGTIEAIFAAGITKGCNPPLNDRFCPDDPVTRGEMAAFVVRALDLPATSEDFFVDDSGSLFEADINRLAAAGITRGCNPPVNDRFCADRDVSRGEMAAFLVRAYGYPASASDAFGDDDGSIFEADINRLAAAGITRGCTATGYCPARPVTRAEMASFLSRAEGLTPTVPPPRAPITLQTVASGLTRPVYVTAPAGDDRVFIVQKDGVIKIVQNGVVLGTPFLDLSSKVSEASGEMGLLSMAFHPDYGTNGRFFVYYSRAGGSENHTSVISGFEVSTDPNVADPTEHEIMTISQPFSNHNGGELLFGPGGYLFVGLGDGGSGGDPRGNGQNPNTLLGSILRLDVDAADPYVSPPDNPYVGKAGADEIWAIGVRNPWRYTFDGGLLYVADVGQSAWEELSVVPDDVPGLNFGWNVIEGSHCYEPSTGCSKTGKVLPIVEYQHEAWCSIIGGVVYRGTELTQLRGRYLYSDLCDQRVHTLVTDGTQVIETGDLTSSIGTLSGIWSFGVDGHGEVYIVRGGAGTVERLSAG